MSALEAGEQVDSGQATAGRRPRADAVRNRERLLAAATIAFEQQGPDASLDEIARSAGVGIGTLYRHFPTREALLEAVFRGRIDALSQLGDELLASPEPFDALTTWLRAHLVNASACQGLAGSVLIDLLDEEDDGEPPGANTCGASGPSCSSGPRRLDRHGPTPTPTTSSGWSTPWSRPPMTPTTVRPWPTACSC